MTTSFPKLSIITPSYNQGVFIERTIKSVLDQKYPNLEFIIMDGGSSDNTTEILKKYDSQLIWFSEPDRGQSHALNKGFKLATGEIIGWINSDDTYKQNAFESAVGFLNNNPDVSMVYGDCDIIDAYDSVIGVFEGEQATYAKILMNKRAFIPQMTVFFRREIFDEIGYIDEDYYFTMDTDFFIRIAKKRKIRYMPVNYSNHRLHDDCKSVIDANSEQSKNSTDRFRILKKHNKIYLLYYYWRYVFLTGIKRFFVGSKKIVHPSKGYIKLHNGNS